MKSTHEPLSGFLHSAAWAAHSGGTFDDFGNVFTRHTLPKGHYWRSTRCVIPSDWKLPDFVKDGGFIRLQPDTVESAQNLKRLTDSQQLATAVGPTVQPKQTLWLDLTQSDEQLLEGMKPKHRYNIKVAQKHRIQVTSYASNLLAEFPRFWKLLTETSDRHTFNTHTEAHYRSIIEHLEPEGMVHLVFAHRDNEDVAAIMLIVNNDVGTYLHGGSSYMHRSLMAPYLLHWETMRYLKAAGCTKYDLWGTNAVNGEPIANHSSAGTTRFKLGFGGTILEYPQTTDIVFKRFWYSAYSLITRLRSRNRSFS